MSDLVPCSEYESANNRCRSGHVRLHPICRGVVTGCRNCGAGNVPMCMMDDQPSHLIRQDGMPLGWPIKATQRPTAASEEGEV